MNNDINEISKNIKDDVDLPHCLRNIIIQKADKANVTARKNVMIKVHQSALSPIPGDYYKPISKCFKIKV